MTTKHVQSHADKYAHAMAKGNHDAATSHLDAIQKWVNTKRVVVNAALDHELHKAANAEAERQSEETVRLLFGGIPIVADPSVPDGEARIGVVTMRYAPARAPTTQPLCPYASLSCHGGAPCGMCRADRTLRWAEALTREKEAQAPTVVWTGEGMRVLSDGTLIREGATVGVALDALAKALAQAHTAASGPNP